MEMISGVIGIGRLSGKSNKGVGSARRRQGWSIKVRGQKAIDRSTERSDWANESSGLPGQHLGSIEGKRLRAQVRRASRVEDAHAHVIGIRPDAEMGIIEKVSAERNPVAI